jgi:hypothetical protein
LEKLAVRLPSVPHLYARQLFGSEEAILASLYPHLQPVKH